MCRAKSVQHLTRIKSITRRGNTIPLGETGNGALSRLHYDRRRDRVDVTSARPSAAFGDPLSHPHLYEKDLRGPATFVGGSWRWGGRIVYVLKGRQIHRRVNLGRAQVA